MIEAVMPGFLLLVACLPAALGFAGLALSQDRHLARVSGSNGPVARILYAQRTISLIAIGLSLPVCIALHGASFGSLLWALLLPAAATTIALVLSYRPRWLRPLARVASVASVANAARAATAAGACRAVFNPPPTNEVFHVPDPADRVS